MKILEIKNLIFRYKNKFIFDNFNLDVEKGTWVTIAGPNGAGKTTLVKILAGITKECTNIKIFDKECSHKNLKKIKEEVGFVFDNPENYFACETVEDELAFSLENMAIAPKTIKHKIDEIKELLDLDKIMDKNPYELSGGEQQKVALGCAIILEPRLLILDEALLMIDIKQRNKIFKILREYCTQKRVTILSFTHDLEETLYSDRLIVLNDGKIIIDGVFPDVYNLENVMRKIGLEVPFSVELCQKLNLVGLLDGIELDLEKVADKLWK